MRSTVVVTIAGLWAAAACQRQQQPAVDSAAAKAALQATDRQYAELAKTKNLDAFVAFYTSDATMYPPGSAAATGLDAIRAVGNSFLSDPAFAGTFRAVTADVSSSGDLGYTLDAAELTATGPDGKPATERLRDFHLWRRQADGSWKIVVDIWNAEAPPPAATAK